jgi:hypothetical protein
MAAGDAVVVVGVVDDDGTKWDAKLTGTTYASGDGFAVCKIGGNRVVAIRIKGA